MTVKPHTHILFWNNSYGFVNFQTVIFIRNLVYRKPIVELKVYAGQPGNKIIVFLNNHSKFESPISK